MASTRASQRAASSLARTTFAARLAMLLLLLVLALLLYSVTALADGASNSSVPGDRGASAAPTIDGANARAALGADVFITRRLSVGLRATAEVLFLARHGVALRDLPNQGVDVSDERVRALEGPGSSVGAGFGVSAGPAVHF